MKTEILIWCHLITVLKTWLASTALLFLKWTQGRQWFNTTARIISLCFTSRFIEKLILFLKNFLCRRPSGHSWWSGYEAALLAHPTSTFLFISLGCVAISWSLLSACRRYLSTNTYLPFSSSPKTLFSIFFCEFGTMQAPSGGQNNICTFLQDFTLQLFCGGAKVSALRFKVVWP